MIELTPEARKLQAQILGPWFPFWMLVNLPSALFVGLRPEALDPARCAVSVPYGWRSQNPFRSTYFAAQAMAAEMSTGALCLLAVQQYGGNAATLIVDLQARFTKKATERATFTCEQGEDIFSACERAFSSGEPQPVTVETVGRLPDGSEVSRFQFTWSFKRRS